MSAPAFIAIAPWRSRIRCSLPPRPGGALGGLLIPCTSTRSLAILAALAALLVFAVIWDLVRPDRTATPGAGRLVPACERVTRVAWERPGTPVVTLQHVDGRAYELRLGEGADETRLAADARVVEDVLGTLELLSPRRALPARPAERGLDPAGLRIHVACDDGRVTTLALGDHIAALDRVWLARLSPDAGADRPGTDYLIEGHAARALDRSVDALRARRVFARLGASVTPDGLSGDARIALRQGPRALIVSGRPALVQLDAAAPELAARADLDRVSALVRRLRDLVIVHFVDEAHARDTGAEPLIIHVRDQGGAAATLEDLGPCPAAPASGPADLRLVRTQLGTGCVDTDDLAAVAGFVDQPRRMIARTLVHPGSWERMRILAANGVSLELAARGGELSMTVDYGGHGSETLTAERAAVDEWLAVLAAAAGETIVPVAELDHTPALAFSMIVQQSGAEPMAESVVEVYRDPRPSGVARWLARRDGEPVYLVLDQAAHAAAIMPVAPLRFLPRTLLVREPFALREVIAHDRGRMSEILERGELIDDWAARSPARAAVRPGSVNALRHGLARLRAVRFVAEAPAPAHRLTPPRRRVEAVFDPGPLDADVPIRDRIDIGADTPHGCLARLDTGKQAPVFELDRVTCDALLGPWTAR